MKMSPLCFLPGTKGFFFAGDGECRIAILESGSEDTAKDRDSARRACDRDLRWGLRAATRTGVAKSESVRKRAGGEVLRGPREKQQN